MMTWNYRVFREEEDGYVIREVFYTEDGRITACTVDAVEPFGETLEELAQNLEDFKAAFALPVLTMNDIPTSDPAGEEPPEGKTISHDQLRRQLGLDDTPHRGIVDSQERRPE